MKQTNNTVVDHRLGNLYPVLDELHKNLKEVTFVAQHIHSLRSGNIELGMNEDGMMQWKYTAEGDGAWRDFVNVVAITKDTVITTAGDSINTLSEKYQTVANTVATLSDLIKANQRSINSINSTLDNVANTLTTLDSSIQQLNAKNSSQDGEIKEINTKLEQLNVLNEKIVQIEGNINSLVSRVQSLEDKVNSTNE